MSPLEKKKLQVELSRVRTAREDCELRIMEFKEQIERLEASIHVQLEKEAELETKLGG
jgi:predicted  nucleic acid-binding Zn-ribbon protein